MSSDDGPSLELFLRTDPVPAVESQQQEIHSRVAAVAEDVAVRYHPKRVAFDAERDIVARFEAVREWADSEGFSLSPFFEQREGYDPETGRVRELLVLPVLWLAVADGGTTRAAYPHVDDEVRTVSEAVSGLESTGRVATAAQTGSNR
ncbi:HTH domain-containing protein [Natronomonas marina]|jgi:hypothetical protein|uniref:HTH domain-containing protein n=1 Tax=Natronomonas marina TaxID=2961939 RepID=UPI0020C984DA|nr:HTH domain-containing protein [Natronomonas marina]